MSLEPSLCSIWPVATALWTVIEAHPTGLMMLIVLTSTPKMMATACLMELVIPVRLVSCIRSVVHPWRVLPIVRMIQGELIARDPDDSHNRGCSFKPSASFGVCIPRGIQ